MNRGYSLGLDFGTGSVRALLLDMDSGEEVISVSSPYPSGTEGVITGNDPAMARQNPKDYSDSLVSVIKKLFADGADVSPSDVAGIGICTTGSTILPVDKTMTPLSCYPEFSDNPAAMAWLWKDHTSVIEADRITRIAAEIRPEYLAKCGGYYSTEWFFSKILHCYNTARDVFAKAHSWMEISDYIPALICGIGKPEEAMRNTCAAGHKAMYNPGWGGLPDTKFLNKFEPALAELRPRLYDKAVPANHIAGYLSVEWAGKLGLTAGIPVAAGILDAHAGGIGSGVGKNILVKIIGTSSCDIMVHPADKPLADIPGVAGIVPDSVLPGYTGIEAGQSAVGDIFGWWIKRILKQPEEYHAELTALAEKLKPGESGLLALDWNNGNRNVLGDPELSGLLLGQTLATKDYEIYRALLEAAAFGGLKIMDRMEEYGITINKVVCCGGITHKNKLLMQIYADVFGRPVEVAGSRQAVALGAAITGAAAADKKGENRGIEYYQSIAAGKNNKTYSPDPEAVKVYKQLYGLYSELHDNFGAGKVSSLAGVMKKLRDINTGNGVQHYRGV